MDRLFVYGTLRLGSTNEHARWLSENARHLGVAHIPGRLYRAEGYPALASARCENEWVQGDLFEAVTDRILLRLDEYEGAAYTRKLSEIELKSGPNLAAHVYWYALPLDGLEWIPSGDWNRWNDEQAP